MLVYTIQITKAKRKIVENGFRKIKIVNIYIQYNSIYNSTKNVNIT